MAWTQRFIDALKAETLFPEFLLESIAIGQFRPTSGDLRISSHVRTGYISCISLDGSSIVHPELRPGDWTRTFGSLRISVTPDVDVRPYTTRGQFVALRVGFQGWATGDFQTVFLGMVRNIVAKGNRWSIEIVDAMAALACRFEADSTQQALFFNLGETTLGANYTAGAATVTVGDNSVSQKSNTESYVIKIWPTTGDPFYLTATGTGGGGTTFTGCSATGQFNSTAVNAVSGDRVQGLAYTASHPINVVRRILTSTGTAGQNGSRDILPASWGYKVPVDLVDAEDCDLFQALSSPASGSDNWSMLVEGAQEDAFGWLQSWLAPGAFFVSQHQGRFTARAVLSSQSQNTSGSLTITDDDIVEISEYKAFDEQMPIEYARTRVRAEVSYATPAATPSDPYPQLTETWGASNTRAETTYETRPARNRRDRDLYAVTTNGSAWCTEVNNRMGSWDLRPPERLTLQLRGWLPGVASVGDIVRLKTRQITPRNYVDGDTFDNYRPALVIGGGADWFTATSRLVLLVHPSAASQ